jgi:outer membrane protein assembly factor BamB
VIGSQGTIQLGLSAKTIIEEEFKDVWSINAIAVSGGMIYVGTSPNGGIYRYSFEKLEKIYPTESEPNDQPATIAEEPNDPNEGEIVIAQDYLSNEHIFALSTDLSGRLLAGISGNNCSLIRFDRDGFNTIFEPNDANYIFAIALGKSGDIYLGTGPEGKIYRLDHFGKGQELVYDSTDKNILSLAVGDDGFIYAGSDTRGLIYRIDPMTKKATVLYDSEQEEITALLYSSADEENVIYAAATSAKIVAAQKQFTTTIPKAGRPDSGSQENKSTGEKKDGIQLKIANTKKGVADKQAQAKQPAFERGKPSKASFIYKITEDGFVTQVFSEAAVFFSMAKDNGNLLVGTGNNGQLYNVDPGEEEEKVVYEDAESSQITSVITLGKYVYAGTANPAKLVKMGSDFSLDGTYTSDLIDATQPAKWGKLQLEADIPSGCRVLMSCRSGNVSDVNDPTFSEWTPPVEVTEPTELRCPAGRFCQYKLILKSDDGTNTPVVREVAVAHVIPNLAPKVEAVSVERITSPDKIGKFKISYKATDDNGDKLVYQIHFRKSGRQNWIELKDETEADNFEWDGRTVEDGRYEIRITASDERSNTAATKLTGSRISDPVVVDNTGPAIEQYSVMNIDAKTIKISFTAVDQLSVIDKIEYTINSNDKWIGTLPVDLVYDTTSEEFVIQIEDLKAGENVIAIKAVDDAGNTTYKSFVVNIAGE